MRKSILNISLLGLLALAVVELQGRAIAQDNQIQKPVAGKTDSKDKKPGVLPFHGKLKAVDNSAKTITVGELTLRITAETKISKAGKPAILEDGTVGEDVGGAYKKAEDGELRATKVRFGPKENPSATKEKAKTDQ